MHWICSKTLGEHISNTNNITTTFRFKYSSVFLIGACFCLLETTSGSKWLLKVNNKYTKPATLVREDSKADVFVWILESFHEQLFIGAGVIDCFWLG